MSKNSKITEIAENIFRNHSQGLLTRTAKEIRDEKIGLEYQLEIMLGELDPHIRKDVLLKLAKESEKTNTSFLENGHVNLQEIHKMVTAKALEVEKKIGSTISQEETEKEPLNTQKENIQAKEMQQKVDEKVNQFLEGYRNLSTDEEKNRYLREKLKLDKNTPQEVIDNYKVQMELIQDIADLKANNKTNAEIQKIVDKNPKYSQLTKEQKTINKDGKILFQEQIELQMKNAYLEEKKQEIEEALQKEGISEKKKQNLQVDLEKTKNALTNNAKAIQAVSQKTSGQSVYNIKDNQDDLHKTEIASHTKKDLQIVGAISQNKKDKPANIPVENIAVQSIKKPEDLKALLEKGIRKEDIQSGIEKFHMALLLAEPGDTKETFQEIIEEFQEEVTTETMTVLRALSTIELEKPFEEILSSDEEKESLIHQVTNVFEQKPVPINDQELAESHIPFEDIRVDERPAREEMTEDTVVVGLFSLASIKEVLVGKKVRAGVVEQQIGEIKRAKDSMTRTNPQNEYSEYE